MNEFMDANRESWSRIAEDHYKAFKGYLSNNPSTLSDTIRGELGDIEGKKLIHLQCNTGADTISLARLGAKVTGVDLVPENVRFATRLASDLGIRDATFVESNVLEIMRKHDETYDIVYTTEGVLSWIPDLYLWARNVRHLLADDGYLYVLDGHPFFMVWDEDRLPELVVKYPYFDKSPSRDDWIGGYASKSKKGVNYSWMHTIADIINALSQAGLHIEWFHEFDWTYYRVSENMQTDDCSRRWIYPQHKTMLPFTYSLKATVR